MARLRLFGAVRDAAGTAADVVPGDTVADVLAAAEQRYGDRFRDMVPCCRLWVNGEQAELWAPVADGDEVALLPPVSGG